ncbi:MAG: hypothetical protein D6808_02180, partial [Candidatus Dadabacteria bacterium]
MSYLSVFKVCSKNCTSISYFFLISAYCLFLLRRISQKIAVVAVVFIAFSPSVLQGQSFPQRPYVLVRGSDQIALLAKAQNYQSLYNQIPTSIYSSLGSVSSWKTARRVSTILAVSFRGWLENNSYLKQAAKNAILAAVTPSNSSYIQPTASAGYRVGSYPCALGAAFDMIYDVFSPSERQTVISKLQEWVITLMGNDPSVASDLQVKVFFNNRSITTNIAAQKLNGVLCTSIAIGNDATPSFVAQITGMPGLNPPPPTFIEFIRILAEEVFFNFYRDYFNPDGSAEESVGYINYGPLASIYGIRAYLNSGLGTVDPIAGSNLLKTPRWLSLMFNYSTAKFFKPDDANDSHTGPGFDPVLYYLIDRAQDGEALWGLDRIIQRVGEQNYCAEQETHGFGCALMRFLFYPESLSSIQPAIASGFFRDNLNPPSLNHRNQNFSGVGEGGEAIMHNSATASEKQMDLFVYVHDEFHMHGGANSRVYY